MTERALLHVQHLLGVGHLRRTLTLARALAEAGVDTVVASGGFPVPILLTSDLAAPGVRFVQLPAARAADATFKTLLDAGDRPVDDAWRAARRDALLALFAEVDPTILVIELYPFGRRLLRFELEPLLDAARGRPRRPLVACSLRDILHPPAAERVDGIVARVTQDFDLVLVHGDPDLIPLDLSFPAIERIRDRIRYTGYLTDRLPPASGEAAVVVSCGGGAVGEPLLHTALAARPLTRYRDRPWRILVGHNLGEQAFAQLRHTAPPGVTVERARTDFPALLPNALCSVSQAGYNTAIEVLAARTPAVFVPFADEGEVEQILRCQALAARDLCRWVAPDALSAASLAEAIDTARRPPEDISVNLSGGPESARLLLRATAEKATLAADSAPQHEP